MRKDSHFMSGANDSLDVRPPAWAEAALLIGSMVAASWLVVRQLHAASTFDEGVYLNSLRSLEHGYALGRDVYASQPPGFYELLRLASSALPDTEHSIRLAFTCLTIAGFAAVYYVARSFGGFVAGASAIILVAASHPSWTVGTHVAADGAGASVAAIGIAVAVAAWARWRHAPLASVALSALAGALVVFAVSIKLSSITTIGALAALYVLLRPGGRNVAALLAGAAAVCTALIGVFWDVLPELWRDAVALHLHARSLPASQVSVVGGTVGIRSNFNHIIDSFLPRTELSFWFFALGSLLLVVTSLRRNDRRALALLVWPLVVVLFLLAQQPLFEQHVYLLSVAAAAPSGIGLGRIFEVVRRRDLLRSAGQAVVVLALAALFVQASRTATPSESADLGQAVALIRERTSPGDYVLASDEPIVAFRANRPVPPNLVDTSLVRILTGSLTSLEASREIREWHVQAVLTGHRFNRWPVLIRELGRLFERRYKLGDSVLFLR
jgi:hypothetical protein